MADGSESVGSSDFSIDSVHFYEEDNLFTELDDDVDAGELPTRCSHTHTRTHTHTYTPTHTPIFICMFVYVCMHVCMYVGARWCM